MNLLVVLGRSGSGKSTFCSNVFWEYDNLGVKVSLVSIGGVLRRIAATNPDTMEMVTSGVRVPDDTVVPLVIKNLTLCELNVLDNFPQGLDSLSNLHLAIYDRWKIEAKIGFAHIVRPPTLREESRKFYLNRDSSYSLHTLPMLERFSDIGGSIFENWAHPKLLMDHLNRPDSLLSISEVIDI